MCQCGLVVFSKPTVRKAGDAEATLWVEGAGEFVLASLCELEQIASEVGAWFSSDVVLNLTQVGAAAVHPVWIATALQRKSTLA